MAAANDKKIAFIMCVNDEFELTEALNYINKLSVPNGYETDVITVREAPSMTAGYNAAMESSDAKYKIYMHQDVFLIYKNLLHDMIDIFESDKDIGMIGVLGCRVFADNAHMISRWDTGKVLCNGALPYYHGYQREKYIMDVMAVDGMFMATQTDIPWREDLFDGWDFYDISQSCEFHRKGKRIVVPYQSEYWTYHDNRESNLKRYDYYRMCLISEYQDVYPFSLEKDNPFTNREAYEDAKEKSRKALEELITNGKIEEVCKIMLMPEYQGYVSLKEIEIICNIYLYEKQNDLKNALYQQGMSYEEVYTRFSHLRHLIKRLSLKNGEYDANKRELELSYSAYAISRIRNAYEPKLQAVYDKKCSSQKTLVIKKMLSANEIKNYDASDVVFLVEETNRAVEKSIKYARILKRKFIQFVTENQDSIYENYRYCVIYGNDREEYVKLFHNTNIEAEWHTTDGYYGKIRYSKNITIKSDASDIKKKKDKALMLTHELRASGAPMVLFEMAKVLQKKYDILVLSLEDGIMHDDFVNCGMEVRICPKMDKKLVEEVVKNYKFVIANTIMSLTSVYNFVERDIPVMWWIHESSPAYVGREELRDYYQKVSRNVKYYAAGRKAQANFENYCGKRAKILEFGLEDVYDKRRMPEKHNKIRFFCPSAILYNKGQDILAGVIQLLPPAYQNRSEFIFIGEKSTNYQLFYNEIERLNESYENVILLDVMSKSAIYDMYYDMDVIVAPSREDATPATIVEGMMYHKVCLASDGTGISYYMTDGTDGFIFKNGDILHALEKVKYIIDNFNQLDELRENGRKLYENIYSQEAFEENVWKMIDCVTRE